jgi:hypothetical protein
VIAMGNVLAQAFRIIEQEEQKSLARRQAKVRAKLKRMSPAEIEAYRAEVADRAEEHGVSLAVARSLIVHESAAKLVDRSEEAVERRQRAVVTALTSGQRCSLNRAYRLAGYGKHLPSLDQLLGSPGIRRLFREAVSQGRPLPLQYAERIEQAIGDPTDDDLTREMRELGIVD